MNRSYAEKFIKKQFNQLRKNIPRSFSLKNWDAIHDFRVALKRIVSILKFIKQHDLKKNINSLYKVTKLNVLYDTGGELREIQINRRILKTYRNRFNYPFLAFSRFLRKKEKIAGRKLKRSRVKFSFRKCRKFESQLIRTIREIPERKMLSLVDHFISGRISEIEFLILDHHVESKLHRIRKLIKSIKYMLEMSGLEKRSYGTLNFTIDKITLLEDHIGHWHDLFIFQEEIVFFREWLEKRGRSDLEVDLLVHVVQKDYEKQFQDTVQHIYTDFDIPKRSEIMQ
ncbi:MAG: CHAD domain-containing protein [Cyclobacteriaceae bacterium]|nr:CHAD domain-containing protein [Cyclobacteriaceae bacterium]